MSDTVEIDFEAEKALVDGAWLGRDELWERMNQSIGAKDYRNISRLAGLLEQLDQALAGAQSITIKLSGEHFAKLEAAGGKLGKSAAAFAREVLVQVLGGTKPAPQPAAPAEPPPVVEAPPAEPAAPAGAAPLVVTEAAPDEGAALTLQPKKRDPLPLAGTTPQAPPVMTPVAAPVIQAPPVMTANAPSVVVEDGEDDRPKPAGEGRRWFNRT